MIDREKVMGDLTALAMFLKDKKDPISLLQANICTDALELLKAQPAKIKTLHEFQHDEMEGAIVWLETNDDTLYWLCPDPDGHWSGWALHFEDLPDSTEFLTFGVDLPTYLSDNEYGKTWRIWTAKPTAEQMKRSVWIGW